MATATDIQDIADILGVTFQEHCSATPLKVFCLTTVNFENVFLFANFAFGGTFQEHRSSTSLMAPTIYPYNVYNVYKNVCLLIQCLHCTPLPGLPPRGAEQYKHRRGDQEGVRQRLRADRHQLEQHQVHLGREVGQFVQGRQRDEKRTTREAPC